jgi:hypothetical protein
LLPEVAVTLLLYLFVEELISMWFYVWFRLTLALVLSLMEEAAFSTELFEIKEK